MKILIFSLTVLFLTFFSCSKSKQSKEYINQNSATNVNFDSTTKYYSLASNLEKVSAVNIETTDNSIISNGFGIGKVILKESKYYIFDNKYMAVKVFDSSGRFLYNLGKLGYGDGLYINIQDIEYYPPHNTIRILCNTPCKVAEYSLDGKFIKDWFIKFYASSFGYQAPNTLYYFCNQNESNVSGKKNILVTDTNNVIRNKIFDFPTNFSSSVKFAGGVYTAGNKIYYNQPFSNTYYQLNDSGAQASYKIDFKTKNIPQNINSRELFHTLNKYGYLLGTFVKKDNYIGFNYMDDGLHVAFYNTQTSHIVASDLKLDSLNKLFFNSVFESDGKLIMVLDTNHLLDFIKRNGRLIKIRFPNLYEKVILKKNHDNPTLLLFTLKSI